MGPDFATNDEQTATNSFAVYGERAQLIKIEDRHEIILISAKPTSYDIERWRKNSIPYCFMFAL